MDIGGFEAVCMMSSFSETTLINFEKKEDAKHSH
jgi:hypothetical protein